MYVSEEDEIKMNLKFLFLLKAQVKISVIYRVYQQSERTDRQTNKHNLKKICHKLFTFISWISFDIKRYRLNVYFIAWMVLFQSISFSFSFVWINWSCWVIFSCHYYTSLLIFCFWLVLFFVGFFFCEIKSEKF